MTDEPASSVEKLPAPLPVEFRHDWKTLGEKRLAHSEFADGNARTLRTCNHCGLVKITVHFFGGGQVERRWRYAGRVAEWLSDATPPCPGPQPQGEPGAPVPTELVTRP